MLKEGTIDKRIYLCPGVPNTTKTKSYTQRQIFTHTPCTQTQNAIFCFRMRFTRIQTKKKKKKRAWRQKEAQNKNWQKQFQLTIVFPAVNVWLVEDRVCAQSQHAHGRLPLWAPQLRSHLCEQRRDHERKLLKKKTPCLNYRATHQSLPIDGEFADLPQLPSNYFSPRCNKHRPLEAFFFNITQNITF